MGLDVTAWERVERVDHEGDEPPEPGGYDDHAHLSGDFRERGDDLEPGWYRTGGERHDFRAGSYSGYNWWRAELGALVGTRPEEVWEAAKVAHRETGASLEAVPERYRDLPFVELLDFTDCDGYVGPRTSAALAADFAEWAERAEARAGTIANGDYWIETYREFRRAFEVAARGGAVRFH